jgi:ubiquinone/menaquinone biosynthesis C-methylase UbiE
MHQHDHAHSHTHAREHSVAELAGYLAGVEVLPTTAIDLGCGDGRDAVYLAMRGVAVTGIDASADAIERARERSRAAEVDVRWIHGDVLDLPVADASTDLAHDHGCLHHVASADQPRYAAQVARVLRPGGTLLVREKNAHGHHAHAVDEDDLRAMVEGLPLHVERVVRFPGPGGHDATIAVLRRTDSD